MSRLNITVKIWLSVGIFVLGLVISAMLGQIQGWATEGALRNSSGTLFPAAQRSQEAEAGFQRTVKGFSQAMLVQDASALEPAGAEGRQVSTGLQAIASIAGLSQQRAAQAASVRVELERFLSDAQNIYGAALSSGANMTPETQEQLKGMAERTRLLETSLAQLRKELSADLQQQLSTLSERSARQRWIALAVFAGTLLLASALVQVTIRRSITGPILRVIEGVRQAASEAADASERMAQSGKTLAHDAQDQAACIEETSASLEEVAATARENAQRAGDADALMHEATKIMDQAGATMDQLNGSMEVISKSSHEVSAVLKSIDEIAFHTNILALNAAVEAARAGEVGAGFSVVADEVRSLAQRAAQAARQSADIIEKTIADVARGVELVTVAHGAFGKVSAAISGGGRSVAEIANSSNEQAHGVVDIGTAMTRIESVTQNNTVNSQAAAEAAESMANQVRTTRSHLDELLVMVGSHTR